MGCSFKRMAAGEAVMFITVLMPLNCAVTVGNGNARAWDISVCAQSQTNVMALYFLKQRLYSLVILSGLHFMSKWDHWWHAAHLETYILLLNSKNDT